MPCDESAGSRRLVDTATLVDVTNVGGGVGRGGAHWEGETRHRLHNGVGDEREGGG